MADRFCTTYTIGGKLHAEKGEEFLKLVEGFEESPRSLEEIEKGSLVIMDPQIAWGTDQELEAFLVENNLTFKKEVEGKYEYDPECSYWVPGMEEYRTMLTNQVGQILIGLEDLDSALANGKTLATLVAEIHAQADMPVPDFELEAATVEEVQP